MSVSLKKYTLLPWVVSFIALFLLLGLSNPLKAAGERIVTIDGSLTEIVFALGKGEEVVARDITSTYPSEALKLPSVGYMRNLSAEGILSLKPTHVLVTADAKPQKVLTQLKEAGVKVTIIKNEYSLAGVLNKVEEVSAALGVSSQGKLLSKEISHSVNEALVRTEHYQKMRLSGQKPRAIFVLNMRQGNMMVAGDGSRANKLMQMIGVDNPVATKIKGYKPLTPEAAIQYNPEFVITMQHNIKSSGGIEKMKSSQILQMTDAGKKGRIVVLDNGDLSFGPRLGKALNYLADSIYKEKYVASGK